MIRYTVIAGTDCDLLTFLYVMCISRVQITSNGKGQYFYSLWWYNFIHIEKKNYEISGRRKLVLFSVRYAAGVVSIKFCSLQGPNPRAFRSVQDRKVGTCEKQFKIHSLFNQTAKSGSMETD